MTTDQSSAARQGRLIETFLEAGYDPTRARDCAGELHDLQAVPYGTTLVWTLTVGNRTATFPARPDGSLCDPLVLGALIESNRADDEPTEVTVETILVGGRTRQSTPWPVAPHEVVPLLESLAAKPRARGIDGSDVQARFARLGPLGRVGVLAEHDRDPARRWHLPKARLYRGGDERLTVQVGWWDRALTLMWFAR